MYKRQVLLPYVESGVVVLIGSTTENPSFEVIGPLLSRTQVIVFKKISNLELVKLLKTAIESEKGLNIPHLKVEDGVLESIAELADGDARQALNLIEIVVSISQKQNLPITISMVGDILQKQSFLYDKSGEEHYNMLSAFHKSLRGSDPDGAVSVSYTHLDVYKRQGGKVGFIGTVGNDDFGKVIQDRLRFDGVDLTYFQSKPDATTGVAFVAYFSDGSRKFLYHIRNAASGVIGKSRIVSSYFKGARFLHINGSAVSINQAWKETIYSDVYKRQHLVPVTLSMEVHFN